MKLRDKIKYEATPFEVAGETWYMKPMTVKDAQKLQRVFSEAEGKEDEMSHLLYLFTDILVGDDGKPFEEVEAGLTVEDLCEMLPVSLLQQLADKITDILTQGAEGN